MSQPISLTRIVATDDSIGSATKLNALFAAIFAGTLYGSGTVASLPIPGSAPGNAPAGARSFVTDSTVAGSGNFGAIVAGGSNHSVPVYCDGTNWLVG